ncbi:MAG TPA: S41 family peptidase, partial [Pirellulaceae bacterium]
MPTVTSLREVRRWSVTDLRLSIGAAVLVATGMIMLRDATADLVAPTPADRRITLWVANLLRQDHLLKRSLDDEMSARAFKMFVEGLDPLKLYFLQSDVDEFMGLKSRLDDMVKAGDLSGAYAIFNRYMERTDQCTSWVPELVALPHDFTAQETLPTEPDEITYSKTVEEQKDRWRRRIKYDLLSKDSEKIAPEEAREQILRRYKSVAKRQHQLDSEELLEMFLTAVTSSFDPHTSYMSKSTLENFEINMRLNLDGIGAALRSEDGNTILERIIPGGAADKHGKLKPKDRIVSVGQGDGGEMTDVVEMKLNDVVDMIRGHAGTVVRLGVISPGETDVTIHSITRAHVELRDSEARSEIIEVSESELQPGGSPDSNSRKFKIGVIDLPSFYMDMEGARLNMLDYKSSTRDVARILEQFRSQNVDCVVLDLSRNGGGSLTEAIDLTGLFVDRGPVVQIKDAAGLVQKYNDETPGMAWNGPLVVLISKFSASASEILAGAIQDYRRGVIVGDISTHGKGTVQSLQDLGSRLFNVPDPPNFGALKITMQQFYRPCGDSTQKRGVLSDVILPSLTSQMDVGEADLDYAIEFERVQASRHDRYDQYDKSMLES